MSWPPRPQSRSPSQTGHPPPAPGHDGYAAGERVVVSSREEPSNEGRRGGSVGWAVIPALLLYIHLWVPFMLVLFANDLEPLWLLIVFGVSYAPLHLFCEIPVVGTLLFDYLEWLFVLCGGEMGSFPPVS